MDLDSSARIYPQAFISCGIAGHVTRIGVNRRYSLGGVFRCRCVDWVFAALTAGDELASAHQMAAGRRRPPAVAALPSGPDQQAEHKRSLT